MARSSARINFKVKTFVDRRGVINKINKWKLGQLARIGAYARGAMKKQIRPALKGTNKSRTLTINIYPWMVPTWRGTPPTSMTVWVGPSGVVLNAKTGKLVPKEVAWAGRAAYFARRKGQGEGKPPRRGPTDKLRRHIYFSIDVDKESVVIGPEKFTFQPAMVNRVSVPELLNKGGVERLWPSQEWVKYGPRPYVETILPKALAKLRENIHKKPVSNRI